MANTLTARFLINGSEDHDHTKTYTADGLSALNFSKATGVSGDEVAFTLDISQIVFSIWCPTRM